MVDSLDRVVKTLTFSLPDKWFSRENQFLTFFWKKCKESNIHYFKISDADPRIKPYDSFCVIDWMHVAIEAKAVTIKNKIKPYMLLRWSSAKLAWWQVKWLTDNINSWGISLVIVYNKKINNYIIFDFKELTPDTEYSFIK